MNGEVNNNKQKLTAKTIVLIGIIVFTVLYFAEVINTLKYLYGVIFPLLLGATIAYVLNILVSGYEKVFFPNSYNVIIIGIRRGACIILSVFTIILLLFFFLRIVIPQFSQSIGLLAAGFPVLYDNVYDWASQHADEIPVLQQKLEGLNMDGAAALKKVVNVLGDWAWGTVSFMGSVFGVAINVILAFIFAIYILFGKEDLNDKFGKLLKAYMRTERRERLCEGLRTADETFSNYIIGQCKEAIILGLLCTIGMLLFRFPYATIIGPVIGLTALVPMVGAYIGAAIGFLLIVIVDPIKALFFILFITILQQVEGNIIYPKVVGDSIGLPGIWVFAAITVGAGLLGIAGVLLGVPVAATVYKLLDKSINERLC